MNKWLTILAPTICIFGTPLLTQPVIGGGTCGSSSLNGPYEFAVSATGEASPSKIFRDVGVATFDGQSNVTISMTADSATPAQTLGASLDYSGTYSVQSNCGGTINITSGDTAAFSIEVHNSGGSFSLIGSDATWVYNGGGNSQPASLLSSCQTSSLSRPYGFAGNGSLLTSSSVSYGISVVGQLQFDGQGNVTANWTQTSTTPTGPLTSTVSAMGTYSIGEGCTGTATVTDSSNNQYTVAMSLFTANPDAGIAVASPVSIFSGTAFPTSTSATTAASCSASTLNGTYEFNLNGNQTVAGQPGKLLRAVGTAVLDGQGNVTFAMTSDAVTPAQAFGTSLTYRGTYSLASNCSGTINITTGDTATLTVVVYLVNPSAPGSADFQVIGPGSAYVYNGASNLMPSACATSTLSGGWSYTAGVTISPGTTQAASATVIGSLQFDGQGNASAAWSQILYSGATSSSFTASGTYTINSACVGSLTLTDAAGNKYSWSVVPDGATTGGFVLIGSSPQSILSGGASTMFINPGLAVVNSASYTSNSTPAGSVFSIFGSNLATRSTQAISVPLPLTLLTTSVTVNGGGAPLFYADQNLINAQMPEDIQPGIATVIVHNGTASNAVAVTVPATGTPGIIVYGTNRAVVVNANGAVNSPTAPAAAGDTVVVYYLGGGPVNAAGTLVTGVPTPLGLSPLSEQNSIKVGGVAATVVYSGLGPGSIGLYQGNFVVPKVTAGDHPLVITIGGQSSNNPLIAVK